MIGVGPAAPDLIERRLLHGERGDDALGRLLPAAPSRTLDWMTREAELADGSTPGCPIASAGTIDALVAAAAARDPGRRVRLRRNAVSARPLIRIGLLRSACGLRPSEIGARVRTGASTVHGRVRTHEESIRSNADYAQHTAAVQCEALAIDWAVEGRVRPDDEVADDDVDGGANGRARW